MTNQESISFLFSNTARNVIVCRQYVLYLKVMICPNAVDRWARKQKNIKRHFVDQHTNGANADVVIDARRCNLCEMADRSGGGGKAQDRRLWNFNDKKDIPKGP